MSKVRVKDMGTLPSSDVFRGKSIPMVNDQGEFEQVQLDKYEQHIRDVAQDAATADVHTAVESAKEAAASAASAERNAGTASTAAKSSASSASSADRAASAAAGSAKVAEEKATAAEGKVASAEASAKGAASSAAASAGSAKLAEEKASAAEGKVASAEASAKGAASSAAASAGSAKLAEEKASAAEGKVASAENSAKGAEASAAAAAGSAKVAEEKATAAEGKVASAEASAKGAASSAAAAEKAAGGAKASADRAAEAAKNSSNRKLYEAAGAVYNEGTGFYELNGLEDITETEMAEICTFQPMENLKGVGINYKARTNLWTNPFLDSGYRVGINFQYFMRNSSIEILVMPNTNSNVMLNCNYAMQGCNKLKEIIGIMIMKNTTDIRKFLNGCPMLTSFKIKDLSSNFEIGASSLVSKNSLLYLVKNAGNNTKDITITLHPDVYAMANSDSEIQAALQANGHISLVSA